MHTDEFEISLSRELNVCKNTIHRIKTTLALMEQKYRKTTEDFIKELSGGAPADDPSKHDDYEVWKSSYESLQQWQELERQYLEGFQMMKVTDKDRKR